MVGFVHELGDGKLTCQVYRKKEIVLALHGLNFGDIDMKEADGVSLKLPPLWLITLNIGFASYAMPLQTPIQS